ncbi:3'-5' exoribonuclease YhaM family protein [Desulfosoma caldarium]|uniref:3'-5' exoribonuclease n=1 Tax=Desulfosoma caldarium TaxID=610254 RepID=A0A3N1VQG8_9BACT|nr:HD domain-containing protein [Desulfosoma caldarium]ROR03311.1 3'-5' exoribonuclease [Desulfosoma caldarium]
MAKDVFQTKKTSPMQCVADIGPNQDVVGIFAVEEKQLRTTKNGKPFLTLKLRDKTGSVTARLWENAAETAQSLAGHRVLRIQGRSELFRDELQIHVQTVQAVPEKEVNPSDFLPVCPRDVKEMWREFSGLLQGLTRKPHRELVQSFLADKPLMQRFRKAPGAKSVHHAYLGGLLEHTVGVMRLASLIADVYPRLDRDLLLLGAFLHDIGKIYEYTYDLVIDYSDVGRLVGHMVLGVEILNAKLMVCKGFPEETAMVLKHLILSHHGETEYGAVQKPMTREALALHLADDLDARMNSVDEILSKSDDPESAWTAYQQLYGRYFYKGSRTEASLMETGSALSQNSAGREKVQLPLWPEGLAKGLSHDDA